MVVSTDRNRRLGVGKQNCVFITQLLSAEGLSDVPLKADPSRKVNDGAHYHIFDGALVIDLALAVKPVDYVRKGVLIKINILVDATLVENLVRAAIRVLAIQSLQHRQESGFGFNRLGRHFL